MIARHVAPSIRVDILELLIRALQQSRAGAVLFPMRTSSGSGSEARMNRPGKMEGNWRWRCTEEMLSTRAFEWLRDLTKTSGRWQGGS